MPAKAKSGVACVFVASTWLSLAAPVVAELKPISDAELSEFSGQAYISIDKMSHPDPEQNTSYTRINLGMDVETQLNMDVLELGRYDREGEKPGSSDVLIHNFSLGYLYNEQFYRANPDAVRPQKADGSAYADGEIVPFKITDPFLEFAFDETTGQMTGVRIGFGDAMGTLSGDITYLTGNVNVDIVDHGEGLRAAESDGSLSDELIILLSPLLEGDTPLKTKAQLVNDTGELDPVRAEYIGVPDGEVFRMEGASGLTRWALKNLIGPGATSQIEVPGCNGITDCPDGDVLITAQDCKVIGIQSCFDLGQYRSFPIGEVEEKDGKRFLAAPVSGLFMSFQTEDLDWLTDVRKENPTAEDFMRATSGAFFNIPNSATQVNLEEALYGTARVRTEFIDRGRGLF